MVSIKICIDYSILQGFIASCINRGEGGGRGGGGGILYTCMLTVQS